MIRVTRIVGESFDLESNEEVAKMAILSNGRQEISVEVSEEFVMAVLELHLKPGPLEKETPREEEKYMPQAELYSDDGQDDDTYLYEDDTGTTSI